MKLRLSKEQRKRNGSIFEKIPAGEININNGHRTQFRDMKPVDGDKPFCTTFYNPLHYLFLYIPCKVPG